MTIQMRQQRATRSNDRSILSPVLCLSQSWQNRRSDIRQHLSDRCLMPCPTDHRTGGVSLDTPGRGGLSHRVTEGKRK